MKLKGAEVLYPEGFDQRPVSLVGGVIAEQSGGPVVDLSGYRVLPGIIDMHGDGFERHIAPRRGVMRDLGQGLMSVDAELAANGITTAMLAQFFSWEGGMRGRDFAERFCMALAEARASLLTDMHLQLRFETHLLDDYDRFEALVAESGARVVVFNDHVPHDALSKGKRPPRLTGQALKSGRSPDAHLAFLQDLHRRSDEVPEAVSKLATRLAAKRVLLGSHDDRTAEARLAWRSIGVKMSEFPETKAAAQAAHEAGDPVVLGAPNVVRGGSHSGNVSAAELLQAGVGDALASDYHYPAIRQAMMRLVAEGVLDFAGAWKLVSETPARILGLGDRGQLVPGLRADLVVMEPETGRIGATICGGRISHMAGEVAARFLAAQ
ncbi:alpha-D-ribose 1-methylphosphonate 5-triphosphate diphosphatase [uncultured Shimia sp.]|uniref:alpha-D-ribose 1-methylphosphonate 5-triphosphate diphosphatase n=1 Tax=uncultured Shimia sp. TaxID=573152 RepID=UPI002608C5FB|nr:alpha-D-ribose 1-methylphosphonate 5-triphosphate diphosphatase [uncultured Shimia sp.]